MSNSVANPPALIAQGTGAWCFAAAELMARNYLNLPLLSQYQIARANLMALVNAQSQPEFNDWNNATTYDLLTNQDENNGANLNSERVQLVRNTYGVVNHTALGGTITGTYTAGNVRADINSNKIIIIGNSIHYYVVYGYDDTSFGEFTFLVLDPWPAGQGGQLQTIAYSAFLNWNYRVIIHF